MTAAQTGMLDRALSRAHSEQLRIIGRGISRQTGDRVLIVSSNSDPVRGHVVTIQGNRLHCDCIASQYGRYCAHRALVHEVLAAEAHQQERHETAVLMPARGNAAVSIWK
jgi:hypothetical protein